MSNSSLKEQLAAVAAKLSTGHTVKEKLQNKDVLKSKNIKPKWLDYVQYGIELLKVYFPESFKSANEVKPLKKGIKQDLVKKLSTIDTIVIEDKACMVKSLSYYVNTIAYHKCIIKGVNRINLDGNPEGIVTAEEAQYSLERRQAKLQMKNHAHSPHKREEGNSKEM